MHMVLVVTQRGEHERPRGQYLDEVGQFGRLLGQRLDLGLAELRGRLAVCRCSEANKRRAVVEAERGDQSGVPVCVLDSKK